MVWGVPAFVILNQLFSRAFFARGDTKTPMRFALIVGGAVNIVLGSLTLFQARSASPGIAAATATAVLAQCHHRWERITRSSWGAYNPGWPLKPWPAYAKILASPA